MTKVRTSALGLTATAVLVGATVVGCGGDKNPAASSSAAASTPAPHRPPRGAGGLQQPVDQARRRGPQRHRRRPAQPESQRHHRRGTGFQEPRRQAHHHGHDRGVPGPRHRRSDGGEHARRRRQKVNGPQQPIDIGSNGFMVIGQGSDPANLMEISEAVFVEGRAMVDLESDCVIGNPTPADVLLDLARKQDAAVKAGLPAG